MRLYGKVPRLPRQGVRHRGDGVAYHGNYRAQGGTGSAEGDMPEDGLRMTERRRPRRRSRRRTSASRLEGPARGATGSSRVGTRASTPSRAPTCHLDPRAGARRLPRSADWRQDIISAALARAGRSTTGSRPTENFARAFERYLGRARSAPGLKAVSGRWRWIGTIWKSTARCRGISDDVRRVFDGMLANHEPDVFAPA
jgi:hypothetical protein